MFEQHADDALDVRHRSASEADSSDLRDTLLILSLIACGLLAGGILAALVGAFVGPHILIPAILLTFGGVVALGLTGLLGKRLWWARPLAHWFGIVGILAAFLSTVMMSINGEPLGALCPAVGCTLFALLVSRLLRLSRSYPEKNTRKQEAVMSEPPDRVD